MVDQLCDGHGGLRLHAGDHVGVLLERERRVLMAEPFADDLRGHTSPQSNRGVRVAQVVQSNPR